MTGDLAQRPVSADPAPDAVTRNLTPRNLARRALAEALGTGLLVTIVVGSGIMAARLSPGQIGLELLENSIATALGLTVLILIFAPVSGAHFNPVVTLAGHVLGPRDSPGATSLSAVLVYVPAQIAGAVLANLMFALPAATASTHARTQAVPRLEARGPRGPGHRSRPPDPRRDRAQGACPDRRADRGMICGD